MSLILMCMSGSVATDAEYLERGLNFLIQGNLVSEEAKEHLQHILVAIREKKPLHEAIPIKGVLRYLKSNNEPSEEVIQMTQCPHCKAVFTTEGDHR